jgi:hypothetical protein
MSTAVLFGVLIAAALVAYAAMAFVTWRRFKGARVVTCPETGRPAAVALDAGHAAVSAVWETTDLKVERCSCWPMQAGCDQACVAQIAAAPDGTRGLTMAIAYFQHKRCAICQCPIAPPKAGTLRPGFMHPVTHQVIAWDEVPPEDLPDAFATRRPICPPCTRAESFRRRLDRPTRDRMTSQQR